MKSFVAFKILRKLVKERMDAIQDCRSDHFGNERCKERPFDHFNLNVQSCEFRICLGYADVWLEEKDKSSHEFRNILLEILFHTGNYKLACTSSYWWTDIFFRTL